MRDPEPVSGDQEVLRLTRAIARGDREAFGVFYEAWFDRAYGLARSLTGRDESFCMDVVQDAMLKVVRSLQPFPTRSRLEAWLARVIHTTALDALRRESRLRRREEKAARPAETEIEAGHDLDERIAWISAKLVELSDLERSLLAERFDRGKTLEAAGVAVGLTGSAAHGRIRRVIERLRAMAREVFP